MLNFAFAYYQVKSKIEALANFSLPESKAVLQRFLGNGNYLSRLVPNFYLRNVDRKLLVHNTSWIWSESAKSEFRELKEIIVREREGERSVGESVEVHCDASSIGLGAVFPSRRRAKQNKITLWTRKSYWPLYLHVFDIISLLLKTPQ